MNTVANSKLIQVSAWVLMGSAVLAVVFMLHHPSTAAQDIAGAVNEIHAESNISAWVHGLLILVMIGIWFGSYGLTHCLSWYRVLPTFGFLLFSLGTAGYLIAALVSGFVIPEVAGYFADRADSNLTLARVLLYTGSLTNQTFAKAGLLGTSLGILFWSVSMLRFSRWSRLLGYLGCLIGVLPTALLLISYLELHVTGMTLVVLANAFWYIAVAVLLVKGVLADH